MGFDLCAVHSDGSYLGGESYTRVGSYGCQPVLTGLFLAAYAADRRPESGRVCGWVRSWLPPVQNPGPRAARLDHPFVHKGSPGSVRALIAFNYEVGGSTCTTVVAADDTIARGRQLKPPTDTALAVLVRFHDVVNSMDLNTVVFTSDEVARLAPLLRALLPRLAASCWHGKCAEVVNVFETAAACGGAVHGG